MWLAPGGSMHRSTMFAAVALAALLSFTAFGPLGGDTSAQEATPAMGSPTAATSMLAGLGVADLTLTTDGTDFTMPAEVEAGRYRFVVENSNDHMSADILLA